MVILNVHFLRFEQYLPTPNTKKEKWNIAKIT